uniref:hypothetical protein n=1 Tax=Pluralibacter gergoviae TaxID=61647 RepID=UPI00111338F9|nr:hypothetical protein [Pluralibacter gergoviae]
MKNKTYSLKTLPPVSYRPARMHFVRWLYFFVFIMACCASLFFLGERYEAQSVLIKYLAFGITGLWIIAFSVSLLKWTCLNIIANGEDKAREEWILLQTRKSRRALQILFSDFITCHSTDLEHAHALNELMNNNIVMISQTDRRGNTGVRHSQLPSLRTDTILKLVTDALIKLLSSTNETLSKLSDDTKIKILIQSSTSVTEEDITDVVKAFFTINNVKKSFEIMPGRGFDFIDSWFEDNIFEKSVLLVLALQIDPELSANSAEFAVAMIFGNRYTQEIVPPIALLHRPDVSAQSEITAGMMQAGDNVPLKDNVVEYVWLTNLTAEQYLIINTNIGQYPLQSIKPENIIIPDNSVGLTGPSSPWLTLAAAACAAEHSLTPQMIISGDTQASEILWSVSIMPFLSQPESISSCA